MTRLDLSEQDCKRLIERRAQELASICANGVLYREFVETVAAELSALAAGLISIEEMDKAA